MKGCLCKVCEDIIFQVVFKSGVTISATIFIQSFINYMNIFLVLTRDNDGWTYGFRHPENYFSVPLWEFNNRTYVEFYDCHPDDKLLQLLDVLNLL